MPRISIIVAMASNHAIGKDNKLLWHLPSDLRRFAWLTKGHVVIMGRKTFESIGKPLPGRTNIVVTRDQTSVSPGILIAHSLEEAIQKARSKELIEIFIIGGASIYKQALPLVDRLYITRVDRVFEGDTYFPLYQKLFSRCVESERFIERGFTGSYEIWER